MFCEKHQAQHREYKQGDDHVLLCPDCLTEKHRRQQKRMTDEQRERRNARKRARRAAGLEEYDEATDEWAQVQAAIDRVLSER